VSFSSPRCDFFKVFAFFCHGPTTIGPSRRLLKEPPAKPPLYSPNTFSCPLLPVRPLFLNNTGGLLPLRSMMADLFPCEGRQPSAPPFVSSRSPHAPPHPIDDQFLCYLQQLTRNQAKSSFPPFTAGHSSPSFSLAISSTAQGIVSQPHVAPR